jgi:hypothetical protein
MANLLQVIKTAFVTGKFDYKVIPTLLQKGHAGVCFFLPECDARFLHLDIRQQPDQ